DKLVTGVQTCALPISMMVSQVQRSAERGSRMRGLVQPRVCLNSRKVCSRSKRRKYACQSLSTSDASRLVAAAHSQTGFGLRSPRSEERRVGKGCVDGS